MAIVRPEAIDDALALASRSAAEDGGRGLSCLARNDGLPSGEESFRPPLRHRRSRRSRPSARSGHPRQRGARLSRTAWREGRGGLRTDRTRGGQARSQNDMHRRTNGSIGQTRDKVRSISMFVATAGDQPPEDPSRGPHDLGPTKISELMARSTHARAEGSRHSPTCRIALPGWRQLAPGQSSGALRARVLASWDRARGAGSGCSSSASDRHYRYTWRADRSGGRNKRGGKPTSSGDADDDRAGAREDRRPHAVRPADP